MTFALLNKGNMKRRKLLGILPLALLTSFKSKDKDHTVNKKNVDNKRQPILVKNQDWQNKKDPLRGVIEGKDIKTNCTILLFETEKIGEGPTWHVHKYDELFIVRKGRALFTVGDKKIEAKAGDVLMAPANIPHKFHNTGPGRLETTDIHLSDQWIQENLDDPEKKAK